MSGFEDASGVSETADALLVRATADKLQGLQVSPCQSPRQSPRVTKLHTPLSLPSTAPSTPLHSYSLDGELHGQFHFQRCFSGTSTLLPDPVMEHECDEEGWDHLLEKPLPPLMRPHQDVLEQKLTEVKEMYRSIFGADLDKESEGESDGYDFDDDGTPWIKSVGTGPLTVESLEDGLEEVKELFAAKYGCSVDDSADEVDEDGTPWIRTTGTGPLTLSRLEESLEEVQHLYQDVFGHNVDDRLNDTQYGYDVDGTLWIKTSGMGPLTLATLEGQLDDAKQLYEAKFGMSVEEDMVSESVEYEYDADGTAWTKTVGSGPLTMARLEEGLEDVKQLFFLKYGQEWDSASETEYDEDGTLWVKSTGQGHLTVERLEEQLAEVKQLYATAFGEEKLNEVQDLFARVFGEDEEANQVDYDEDGTPWIKTVGNGPLTVEKLEGQLVEVKQLYAATYGEDVDLSSGYECDAEGTVWIRTVGTGAVTVSSLEEKLNEVQQLYAAKFEMEEDEDEDQTEYDKEGTLWIKTTGAGPLTVVRLEQQLAEVKQLYSTVFGEDFDCSSGYSCDGDGTIWIRTEGTGLLTLEKLEDTLDEVKDLYHSTFGVAVDDVDAFDEDCDADGTRWIKIEGTGPISVTSLEDQLAEVKSLYATRFGEDVDQEAANEEFVFDQDGTPWVKTVGTGPLTISKLEDSLEEVKQLCEEVYGHDTCFGSNNEGSERDADGTLWLKTVGTGPLTTTVLEGMLTKVKDLYAEAYGCQVDEESDCDDTEYDQDGMLWVKVFGTGPLSLPVLEQRLEETKGMYERRFGRFVEDEYDEEEPDMLFDREGTLWFKW